MPVLPVNKDLIAHTIALKAILIYFIAAHVCGIYKVTQIQIWIV